MSERFIIVLRVAGAAVLESLLLFALVLGAARFTDSAVSALILAGTVFLVVVLLLSRRVDRLCRTRRTRGVHHVLGLISAGLALLISALLWLTPIGLPPATNPVPPAPSPAVPAASHVHLPDGTRLAVRRYGHSDPGVSPIVVVHGGPGIPIPPSEQHLFAGLSERQVIIYDQIGTGGSTHLSDPAGYTMTRSIADLLAIIDSTGASRAVLLGHSWGAQIVTQFAARHPDRVVAMVLAAPAPIIWAGQTPPPVGPQSRLSTWNTFLTYGRAMLPRNLFTYLLASANPRTAHALAGDREMDTRFAALIHSTAGGFYCDPRLGVGEDTTGVGFYANQQPQGHPDNVGLTADLLPALEKLPTLVLRPECDYIPESMTREYEQIIPDAHLVVVPDAGHSLFGEQPVVVRRLVDDFLRDSA